jgi:hypothetical protein
MSRARICHRLKAWALGFFLSGACLVGCGRLALGPAPAGAAGTGAPGGGPAAELRWPLDLPAHWLTSNFMEYRGGRFHAGLDLKTRETEGFPAYAVEDGWISRVRATPGGYGRAVSLRGASGRTYVYAHLGRFNDRLGALVAAAQQRDGAYRVELEPAPGSLMVRRGDVLGLTGQSGTTGPHLHFEVRDDAGRPIDPLAAGFAVRDTIAPVIRHLRALPAGAAARLEGGPDARRLPVAGQAWVGGLAPPLRVSGPVAFSALIIDGTDPAGHRLEPALIELYLDGQRVYRRANESFDFAQNAQQRLEWLECGGLREQWLHRDGAVTLAGREGGAWLFGPDGDGLAPGKHRLELAAVDRAGNRSTVGWDLEVVASGAVLAASGGAWDPEPVAVVVAGNNQSQIVLTPFFARLPEELRDWAITTLAPDKDGVVLAPVTLARTVGALTAPLKAQAAAQGLAPAGFGATWDAAAWPVAGAPVFDLPPGVDGFDWARSAGESEAPPPSLYRWDGARWVPAGPVLASATAGGPPRFALERPGLYAAMRDTVPPVIAPGALTASPHPGFGAAVAGVTPPRWTVLAVGVSDAGSGLAAGSVAARWDGRPLIVEPDLLRDRLLVEIPDSTGAGPHELELKIADQSGRTAFRRLAVHCRPAARQKP